MAFKLGEKSEFSKTMNLGAKFNKDTDAFTLPGTRYNVLYYKDMIFNANLHWRFNHDEAHETVFANTSAANSGMGFDIVSNGFKMRTTDATINASGGTYVYMAWAKTPFKSALAR